MKTQIMAIGFALALGALGRETVMAQEAPAAVPPPPKTGETTYKMPLVVLRQQAIEGRVFFIADEQEDEAHAAGIQITVQKRDEDKVLVDTRTDNLGHFDLPDLAVETYRLTIGRLTLELRVVDPETVVPAETAKIPKMIAIFIPRALADTRVTETETQTP